MRNRYRYKGRHRRPTPSHAVAAVARPTLVIATASAVSLGMVAPAAAHTGEHTVQPGDTLSSLAAGHGTSWQTIYTDNRGTIGANPNVLRVGQRLVLSGPTAPSSSAAAPERASRGFDRSAGGDVAAPVVGGSFPLLPSGSALPSDAECAARVQRDPWEPRPQNAEENATRPTGPAPFGMASWTTAEADTAAYRGRVTGDFTGTTDEVIQWASCKWGFPTDLNRAQAVIESTWDMSVAGDGGKSRGLFQMKMTVWGGYPNSAASTAFNADWAMGLRRACYDGVMWYSKLRGDLEACLGVHVSGDPDPTSWRTYVDEVRQMERTKPWLQWPSAVGAPPTANRGR